MRYTKSSTRLGSARGGKYGPDPRVAAWKSPSNKSPAVIVVLICLLPSHRSVFGVNQAQTLDVWLSLSSEYIPGNMGQALSKSRRDLKLVTNQCTKRLAVAGRVLT